jgi:hypothetical protein
MFCGRKAIRNFTSPRFDLEHFKVRKEKMKNINRNFSVTIENGRTDLTIRFSQKTLVSTREELKSLIAVPSFEEILEEAARIKNERGLASSNDEEIEAKTLRLAQRNAFRSPQRGLFGIPETILQGIVEEKIELFRLCPEDAFDEETPLDHEVRISFDTMWKLYASEMDEIRLEGNAMLLKLATVAGIKGCGTFGYYKPSKGKLLIFNADVGKHVADALPHTHDASPPKGPHRRPERSAPRAERPPVGRPARGGHRPRNS